MAVDHINLQDTAAFLRIFATNTHEFFDKFDRFVAEFVLLDVDDPFEIPPETLILARDLIVDHRAIWEDYRDKLIVLSEKMADLEAAKPIVITAEQLRHLQTAARPQPAQPADEDDSEDGIPILPEIRTDAIVTLQHQDRPIHPVAWIALGAVAMLTLCGLSRLVS